MRFTAKDYVEKLDEAIVEFGRYSLQDKGLTDVMLTDDFKNDLKTATGTDVGKLLVEVLDYDGAKIANADDLAVMVQYFVGESDYRDEADFNALFAVDPRLEY